MAWNSLQARSQKTLGQRFEAAGAAGRIVDDMEIGFVLQHELRVAREAAGEGVRRAERLGEGQGGDRVGAADRRRKDRDGGAQQIVPRIIRGHHAPGGFGVDQRRRGSEAAGLLDARPQGAQRAELGDAGEFIGVGGEPEHQHFSRDVEVQASVGEGAQIGEAGRERVAELLRLRPARRMDDAGVRRDGSPDEAGLGGALGAIGEAFGALAPWRRRESVPKPRAQGIEAEGDAGDRGLDVILVEERMIASAAFGARGESSTMTGMP